MSAYIVDKTHIDALITAGLILPRPHGPMTWLWPPPGQGDMHGAHERGEPWGPRASQVYEERRRDLTPKTANRVGTMLWRENRRSVNHRYDENEPFELYAFRQLPGHPDPLVVLNALDCYEYQSCEHPGWPNSEARVFCDALRRIAIRRLPGYDDVPGGEIRDPDIFVRLALTAHVSSPKGGLGR